MLARHFPAGAGQPVVVAGNMGTGPQLAAAFRDVPGITGVTGPKVVAGHAYLEGTLTDPADSGAAADTVNAVRNAVHTVPGADAMVGMLINARHVEKAFAEGKGPDPATMDVALGGAGGGEENRDPLQD